MGQRFKEISAYFLLALFASYYVSTSFFPHTHIVDGKTVVHSHFYFPSAENKTPTHQHSIHAFGVISFLSHFFSTGLFAIIALQVFNRYLHHHKYRKNSGFYFQQLLIRSNGLRAPPSKNYTLYSI
ncbi:hypothetical protein [Anaerorudis cellulosivorans]|uniref:hypothetical protein n=1 Tax=Anaerorudis cellulosivorans TaxID=3397862 RepID=UPI00221F4A36|nr:hypothetical protein [Seramator thermalis]MCW1734330.1 hypothetical protein [Seramator thermalis]